MITIPNQRLLSLAGKGTAVRDAFSIADQVLLNAVRGISDLITVHGLINLDFADVRTVMNEAGVALMGTGTGKGDTRAVDAAAAAISSPLLEDLSIEGARGVLINITGGSEMTLFEVNEASSLVHEAAHEDANIIVGAVIDESLDEHELRVTVIATGLDSEESRRMPPEPRRRSSEPSYTLDAPREIERERAMVDAPNVTPIRETSQPAMASGYATDQSYAAPSHERGQERAQERGYENQEPDPRRIAQTSDAQYAQNHEQAREPEQQQQVAAGGGQSAEDLATTGLGFESPFEDELDTPAFLRKRSGGSDDDRDVPAFMRRGGSE